MSAVAVIPAAGTGSRLGMGPKLLVEVLPGQTIWSILRDTLLAVVDEVVVVVAPPMRTRFAALLQDDPYAERVHVSEQPVPIGMGDAVFRGSEHWNSADRVVVVWGDQVFVSSDTVRRAVTLQRQSVADVVIPVVRVDSPYVEYRFEEDRLVQILQTREGDVCAPGGYGDVGTFVLATDGLQASWEAYIESAPVGTQTGEMNFLPFFVHLSKAGRAVVPLEIADQREARGVNTPEDLALVRSYLQAQER